MRYLTAALLALAFAIGSVSANACEWMKTTSKSTTVASADKDASDSSTKIKVPESKPNS